MWLYQYLLKNPCVDCGESDPVVLEFDHRGDKRLMISSAVNNYGASRLKEEIDKCEVRCSNCHKRKTAIEQGWTMARIHYSI